MDEQHERTAVTSMSRVVEAVIRDELDAIDLPHVVHVTDPYLDLPLVFGPFNDPGQAADFAERYRSDLRYDGCDVVATTVVAPLRPAGGEI